MHLNHWQKQRWFVLGFSLSLGPVQASFKGKQGKKKGKIVGSNNQNVLGSRVHKASASGRNRNRAEAQKQSDVFHIGMHRSPVEEFGRMKE
jgi:hypothetical protein